MLKKASIVTLVASFGVLSFFQGFLLQASASYGIYYGTDAKVARKTYAFDPMIIQPYNLDLYKNYTGKKLCYLSVGEFDGTSSDLQKLGLSSAKTGYNTEWKSFIMNMSDQKWQTYLLGQEKILKGKGCSGLFLDTLWQDGQESGAVAIVRKLRENWKTAYLLPNNAHAIKTDIRDLVDGYMFENFWDQGTKRLSSDAEWYASEMSAYVELKNRYQKDLYAISYGDPFAAKVWGQEVAGYATKYAFNVVFTNRNLDRIYASFDPKTKKLRKFQ